MFYLRRLERTGLEKSKQADNGEYTLKENGGTSSQELELGTASALCKQLSVFPIVCLLTVCLLTVIPSSISSTLQVGVVDRNGSDTVEIA